MDLDIHEQILLYMVDLILNIKDNNLDQIEIILSKLNVLLETEEQFNEILSNVEALIKDYNNDSLLYVIENIKNIDDIRRQKALWKSLMYSLIERNDYEEINTFISDALEEPKGGLFQFQISIIIRLATLTKNFEQLQNIYNFIQEGRVI